MNNKISRKLQKTGCVELMDLSLDLWLEIFRLIFPADLLQLARTNKGFRNIIMKRSSIPIWCVAQSNLSGLPAPFPDMSEPAWANLLFFKSCEASYMFVTNLLSLQLP
ncbi:hypothetical protein ARMSODRAFT_339790 [Armillaria solidipes]|uniref:F-box domain-containing protein n=1 Tax=Armillaria solidipes TaxID=1076256 RepID=A0A2H3BKT3_9AGAR|nr:hypothetical protein ARMSODRAFT_339790 [Armillaria solidipes]